jgi:hypothetical protein
MAMALATTKKGGKMKNGRTQAKRFGKDQFG